MSGAPVVELRGVRKTYQLDAVQVPALVDIDLAIRPNCFTVISGASGSGKSTLLNLIGCIDRPDRGEVLIDGSPTSARDDDELTDLRARRLGFIFQNFNLLPVLTAAENVELPLLLVGVSMKESREKALKALALVGMEERKDHKPAELSGGQQQRVTIARSLVNEPAIVWADEPTGNLDTEKSAEVIELMRELNRQKGLTFVIVTHDPGVGKKCQRIVEMQNGLIIKEVRN